MNRVWAEGKYGNTVIRLGKVPLSTNENGIVLESSFTGFTVQTGKSWKVMLLGGRLNMSKTGAYRVGMGYSRELRAMGMVKEAAEVRAMARDPATIFGVNLQYKTNKKIFGGLGYYHLSSKAYNFITDMDNKSKAGVNIGSINLGYRFSPKCLLFIFFFIILDDFKNGLLMASYSFKGPELGGSLPHGKGRAFP